MNKDEFPQPMQKPLKAAWDLISEMPGAELTGPAWTISAEKKYLDWLIATMLLPVCVPTILGGASLMFLGDGKAPFFRQQRFGKNSVPFEALRVRTMQDTKGRDPSLGSADPRAPRRGKILRKLTIDQFTELVNVFHGDMAVVNPRPVMSGDRRLMRKVLSRAEYAEWEWASTVGRPGMCSTFGNLSIELKPQTEEYLLRRRECDVEDAYCACLARDMKILGDTAKIGWSFVSRGS